MKYHTRGGPAPELAITRITKDEEWLLAHMADPVAIAPGVRSETDLVAVTTFANLCVACHKIAGEGGDIAPDLSRVRARRDLASIKRIISDPTSEFPDTMMPPYGERLSEQQINALVQYLGKRR